MTESAKNANTAMEEESYLLSRLEKVPNGDGARQDCRIHEGSEASARAFGGCPVDDAGVPSSRTAQASIRHYLKQPSSISESVPTFWNVPCSTAKATRNVCHTSRTLRPGSRWRK